MEAPSSNQVGLRQVTLCYPNLHPSSLLLNISSQVTSSNKNKDVLQLRYSLIRALAKGSTFPSRPGLPQAVVARIFSLAQFTWAHPAVSHDCRMSMMVPSRGPEEEKVPWFRTAPFTSEILERVTGFQLSTVSHDQGWVDDPGVSIISYHKVILLTVAVIFTPL